MRPIQTGRVQQYMLVSLIVLLVLAGLAYYFFDQGLDVRHAMVGLRSDFAQVSVAMRWAGERDEFHCRRICSA